MKETILTIVNPNSANGKTGKIWPVFEKEFYQQGLSLDIYYTEGPDHATELARNGIFNGYNTVMAVGGDGTTNEVVNGLFIQHKLINPDLNLIIFSQGTGSDYIRTLGLKKSIEDVLDVINNGERKYFDLGFVTYVSNNGNKEERYFVNLADVGIGGETIQLVNRSSKVLGGFLTYLLGAFRTILKYKNKKIILIIDGKEIFNKEINSVMIGNGKYFGGGIKIAPDAVPDDGLFNIVILGDLSRSEIIINLVKAYKGTHISHPKVSVLSGKKVVLVSNDPGVMELDGETIGKLPTTFSILHQKLPILVKR